MEWPNVLISGTPGTGKSRLCQHLCDKLKKQGGYKVLGVSEVVRRRGLFEHYDPTMDTFIIDERACRRYLKRKLAEDRRRHPLIVESHTISVVPSKHIGLCAVVTVPTTSILYDRLAARGYSPRKLEENMDCEIMQECLQEAHETFPAGVIQVRGETEADLEEASELIIQAIYTWQRTHSAERNTPER